MLNFHSFARRAIAAVALTGAALGAAALGSPIVSADPPKPITIGGGTFTVAPISAIDVQARGTEATLSFSTAEPTAVTVEHKPVTATAASVQQSSRPSLAAGTLGQVQFATGDWQVQRTYATSHQLKLAGLTSNTAYDVTVTAETRAGQRLTAQTRFTTEKKRIRIALANINIQDDGDGIFTGDGEPVWVVNLAWAGGVGAGADGSLSRCYPISCDWGSFGDGRFVPRSSTGERLTFVFAEENFDRLPDSLSLSVEAKEKDIVDRQLTRLWECVTAVVKGGCLSGEETPTIMRVPQAGEYAEYSRVVRGDDTDTGFESELVFQVEVFHDTKTYPASGRNLPHSTWK